MEFGNDGVSLYHNIAAIFARSTSGELLFIHGRQSQEIEASWPQISESTSFAGTACSSVEDLQNTVKHDSVLGLDIYEIQKPSDSYITGVFVQPCSPEQAAQNNGLLYRFIGHILQRSELSILNQSAVPEEKARADAAAITSLFSETLRNIPKGDEWDIKGRDFFQTRVEIFTRRGAMVEMVLPAFPCKSSNTDKVSGQDPDKGEELALKEIEKFTAAVEEIYAPGCKVWIVSDGHVFSDTIGVDDKEVDRYSDVLRKMYRANKIQSASGRDRIGFLSLTDCFGLNQESPLLRSADVESMDLPHFLGTELTDEAEFSRKLLILGFQIDESSLRDRIHGEDKAMVSLYRGFSRFMLEDLALHPRFQSMSRSKTRKLAPKIAFEMIKRNQAYSNLVEVVFPMHVRLSIHAHSNAGPKFGIKTLPQDSCRAVESMLDADLANSTDLLHIPTPWHNSVCKVEGEKYWFVTKSRAIKDALEAGTHAGQFVPSDGKQGGYYCLTKVIYPPTPEATPPATPVPEPVAEPVAATETTKADEQSESESEPESEPEQKEQSTITFFPVPVTEKRPSISIDTRTQPASAPARKQSMHIKLPINPESVVAAVQQQHAAHIVSPLSTTANMRMLVWPEPNYVRVRQLLRTVLPQFMLSWCREQGLRI